MAQTSSVDLIVPSYKPDEKLKHLLEMMGKQTVKPDRIFLINTEEEFLRKEYYSFCENLTLIHIKKEEFDHGGTRNYGVSLSDADFVLLMTQDAVPTDEFLIEKLLAPMESEQVAASYARQLDDGKAGVVENFTRQFNYPDQSYTKSAADIPRLGIKTYFCSNACAMYRRSVYMSLGGFVTKAIFNEDMIMASRMVDAGFSIAYCADAKVVHSHKYTYRQQFTRNFDLGVSQTMYREIFDRVKSESEGVKLVKTTMKYLLKSGKAWLIPDLILASGFKFLGYKLGRNYEKLPRSLVVKFSMNKSFWKKERNIG
ncbi:glycosyltransferase family 2 protein [Anaerolentibacter hominis]|uniref:glycosyltransferase family 2 protein n=1 Tax=Anaerolentibacter hominis TaxID=3079009 RepID=UPI0031B8149B